MKVTKYISIALMAAFAFALDSCKNGNPEFSEAAHPYISLASMLCEMSCWAMMKPETTPMTTTMSSILSLLWAGPIMAETSH